MRARYYLKMRTKAGERTCFFCQKIFDFWYMILTNYFLFIQYNNHLQEEAVVWGKAPHRLDEEWGLGLI